MVGWLVGSINALTVAIHSNILFLSLLTLKLGIFLVILIHSDSPRDIRVW
jgi:hypothetical protein